MRGSIHAAISALFALQVALSLATPAAALCPTSIYSTNFDAFALGALSGSPPNPSQGDWYASLREGGATAEIQNTIANTGRALHLDAPLANPTGLQTIVQRNLTPADLTACPVVVLKFDFRCSTSNQSAANPYTARVSVTGGPHPGYSIIEVSITSGYGSPKSSGVNVSTVAFDSASSNNFNVPVTVGQGLSWDTWHTVELSVNHGQDRLLQITVDGSSQNLGAWKPARSCLDDICSRGQLTEQLNVEIVPTDSPVETLDHLYTDNVSVTTTVPPPPGPCPVTGLIAQTENQAVQLSWRPSPSSGFVQYSVYRSAGAFTSVASLTPVATLGAVNDTTYRDTGLVNGASYHYAVTATITGAPLCDVLTSTGPRRPRNETDLQIVTISRTPRYPRYDPTYAETAVTEPSGFGPYSFLRATGLGSGQTPSTQRWPNNGDPVTYTATVRNRGTNTWTTPIHGQWKVDGVIVGSPTLSAPVQPRGRVTSTMVRNWDGLPHTIEFRLLDADARTANNVRAIDTKSVAFLAYVDFSHIEEFRDVWTPAYPLAATDDCFDWINRHMDSFNQLFTDAGTAKRVHYDVLEEVRDGDPDPAVTRINFAIFPFRFHVGQDNFRSGSAYYSATDDIDFGYLHEMGHQLGLIDLYRMAVEANANQVSGAAYAPPDELMFNVSPTIGPSSASGMTHWLDYAHGYFGQYLYAIPSRVIVKFLGNDGMPMANATVRCYQYCDRPGIGQAITAQIKFTGQTNVQGRIQLPNVPLSPSLTPPTYTGDTLRANPWGYVNMLGTNGTLLLELEVNGTRDYAWLDVTEANVAYYAGQRDSVEFERSLSLIRTTDVPDAVGSTRARMAFANPFRPGDIITLAGARTAAMDLYDVSGRHLRSFALSARGENPARVAWDGRADSGAPLASGVYLIRASADGVAITQRLVLVR